MKVIEVYNLPPRDMIVVPFEGSQPSPTDADEILYRFLGKLAQDNNLFPICYEKLPKVLNKQKDKAWNYIIKVKSDLFIDTYQ